METLSFHVGNNFFKGSMFVFNLELRFLLNVLPFVLDLSVHIGLGSLDWIMSVNYMTSLILISELKSLFVPTLDFVYPLALVVEGKDRHIFLIGSRQPDDGVPAHVCRPGVPRDNGFGPWPKS